MRGQDTTLVFEETQDGMIKDVPADVGIHRAEGVVHDDDVCIEVDGTSDIKSLLLATRDGNASLANFGLVTVGKHVQICLESTSKVGG